MDAVAAGRVIIIILLLKNNICYYIDYILHICNECVYTTKYICYTDNIDTIIIFV